MTDKKKKITLDICGVCTCRDIFGLVPNDIFEIRKYIQLSYPPLFDNSDIFSINPVHPDEIDANHGYNRRTTASELNRTALSSLENSGADWIMIDLRSVPKGLYEVRFGGETHYYSQCGFMNENYIKQSITAKGLNIESIKKIDHEALPNPDRYIDLFCEFMKKRYGTHIILVEVKEALWLLDKEGNVTFKQDSGVEERCKLMDEQFIKFLDRLDCYYIRTPVNILYDSYNHFGDNHHVHYVQEWYDYANKCVEIITSGDKQWIKKMDRLNIELTNKFDKMRGKNILSRTNACRRFEDKYEKCVTTEEINSILGEMSEAVNNAEDSLLKAELCGRIGRFYRDRKDGFSDLSTAAEWMRKASGAGLSWVENELFDILWKINTPESTFEMITRAYEYSQKGDASIMGRIGRAYRDGRGFLRNLQAAAEWMKKSADNGCLWAKWEYFEILWKIGTPESLHTMIEYANQESASGNTELKARLGRAYRDGVGVSKDLRKAANLMKETHNSNPQWAKWEYIDILWTINTTETDKEMFNFALPLAKNGQRDIQGRVGRMYRDGRGVKKDLIIAAEWMRKAANQNLGWCKNELFDILWTINNPDYDKEMVSISSAYANAGDGGAMGRLGKCYRDGRGVDQDPQKAIEWMRKAADKKIGWASTELEKMLKKVNT